MKRSVCFVCALLFCMLLVGCKGGTAENCDAGHLPGEWAVLVEPTVEAGGMRHRVCTRCGVTVESEELAPLQAVEGAPTTVPDGPQGARPGTPTPAPGDETDPEPDNSKEPEVLLFEELGDGTLGVRMGDAGWRDITVPGEHDGKTVTAVLPRGFADCTALSRIVLPDTVTEIGAEAFSGCTALSQITFHTALTRVGASAFAGCTSLSLSTERNGTQLEGILLSATISDGTYYAPADGIRLLADDAFAALPALSSLYLPSSLVSIGMACADLPALTQIFTQMSVEEWQAVAYADQLPATLTVYTLGTWSFQAGVPTPIEP